MLDITRATIATVVKGDWSMPKEERDAIMAIIDGQGAAQMPRLLTRKQVAALINRTPRMVDYFGKRGLIRRVVLGGSSRATGYDAESVRAFINGGKEEGCHAGN
jgi:hypothetical protein